MCALRIEANLSICVDCRHLGEVIYNRCLNRLGENISARTENLHLCRVAESHLSQFLCRDFVYSLNVNGNFHPFSRCQL